jgi:hypothetical protein
MRILVLALTLAATGAHTPQGAVKRFIEPRSAKDACAQLAPAYRKKIESEFGRCITGMKYHPKVTHLVFSHVVIHGRHAKLRADYDIPSGGVEEHYTLVRQHGVWLINGAD